MTLVPFLDCCSLLGVDPKTLRLWLKAANFSWTAHPSDARLKCLTLSQLRQLGSLHGRSLPQTPPAEPTPSGAFPPSAAPAPASSLLSRDGSAFALPLPDADLRHLICLLQAQVATLQAQVTELALALVRSNCPFPSQLSISSPTPPATTRVARAAREVKAPLPPAAPSEPKPPRARSRALPLIQARADGTYVAIAPIEGVLSFAPDSPQWFEWLASLTSFTFQGTHGHFSARRKYRNGRCIQAWSTRPHVQGRSHTIYLGLTRSLTVAHLEHMAAVVHAYPTSL